MHVLHLNSLGNIQIHMSEIPDSTDPVSHQLICHFHSTGLWNRQHSDIDVILPDKGFQLIHGHDLHTADILTHQFRVRIEHSLEDKSTTFEVHIIAQRSSQIACSNDDEIMLLIQS